MKVDNCQSSVMNDSHQHSYALAILKNPSCTLTAPLHSALRLEFHHEGLPMVPPPLMQAGQALGLPSLKQECDLCQGQPFQCARCRETGAGNPACTHKGAGSVQHHFCAQDSQEGIFPEKNEISLTCATIKSIVTGPDKARTVTPVWNIPTVLRLLLLLLLLFVGACSISSAAAPRSEEFLDSRDQHHWARLEFIEPAEAKPPAEPPERTVHKN